MSPSRYYEIRIRGPIGRTLLQAFLELKARRSGPDTVLSGRLADRSALYGVIHQIEALALELFEVRSPSPRATAAILRPVERTEANRSRAKGDLA
jgi:hypothetical protein